MSFELQAYKKILILLGCSLSCSNTITFFGNYGGIKWITYLNLGIKEGIKAISVDYLVKKSSFLCPLWLSPPFALITCHAILSAGLCKLTFEQRLNMILNIKMLHHVNRKKKNIA